MGLFNRTTDKTTVPEVTPTQARMLAKSQNALLLDVREDNEWNAGHAPDATHMPLGSLRPHQVPADRVVVTMCRSGGRSGKAARQLAKAGIDVRNMSGGMADWQSSGLPVVRDGGGTGTVA